MSEELKKGIPKANIIGSFERTEKETAEDDAIFEKLLKEIGVLKEHESIKDFKKE